MTLFRPPKTRVCTCSPAKEILILGLQSKPAVHDVYTPCPGPVPNPTPRKPKSIQNSWKVIKSAHFNTKITRFLQVENDQKTTSLQTLKPADFIINYISKPGVFSRVQKVSFFDMFSLESLKSINSAHLSIKKSTKNDTCQVLKNTRLHRFPQQENIDFGPPDRIDCIWPKSGVTHFSPKNSSIFRV